MQAHWANGQPLQIKSVKLVAICRLAMAKKIRTKYHEYVSEAASTPHRRKMLQRIYDRSSNLKASTEIKQHFEVTCFRLGQRNDTLFPEDMTRSGKKGNLQSAMR